MVLGTKRRQASLSHPAGILLRLPYHNLAQDRLTINPLHPHHQLHHHARKAAYRQDSQLALVQTLAMSMSLGSTKAKFGANRMRACRVRPLRHLCNIGAAFHRLRRYPDRSRCRFRSVQQLHSLDLVRAPVLALIQIKATITSASAKARARCRIGVRRP